MLDTAALATLKFVADVLKPVLGDSLKRQLTKTSAQIARERVYALYGSLGELAKASDEFIPGPESLVVIKTRETPSAQTARSSLA